MRVLLKFYKCICMHMCVQTLEVYIIVSPPPPKKHDFALINAPLLSISKKNICKNRYCSLFFLNFHLPKITVRYCYQCIYVS